MSCFCSIIINSDLVQSVALPLIPQTGLMTCHLLMTQHGGGGNVTSVGKIKGLHVSVILKLTTHLFLSKSTF